MNHFFAIKLSPEARQIVQELAEEWRALLGMRPVWYAPEDYHITLKYLGNLDDSEQPHLIEAAKSVAAETPPLLIRSAPAGGFPDMRAPGILWAGVEISSELDMLATRLDDAVVGLGFRPEHRRYQPHITVAQCRLRTIRGGIDWPLPNERLFAEFTTDQFVLMRTLPFLNRADGVEARYNTVHTFPLGSGQG